MGKIGYAAGGGKVTAENLAAENIRAGVTVTLRQGNKIVREVPGTYYSKVLRFRRDNANGLYFITVLPDFDFSGIVSINGGVLERNPYLNDEYRTTAGTLKIVFKKKTAIVLHDGFKNASRVVTSSIKGFSDSAIVSGNQVLVAEEGDIITAVDAFFSLVFIDI